VIWYSAHSSDASSQSSVLIGPMVLVVAMVGLTIL